MLPHRISLRSITVVLDGKVRTISNEAANYNAIVEALRQPEHDEQFIRDLIDIPSFIKRLTFGRVVIEGDKVLFNGDTQSGYMADRIINHLHAGVDIAPYARFIDNLMDNPTEYVREDLFKWVEAGDMPFTDDGCFLAYKYVQDDYYSAHTGTNGKVFHGLGEFVTMPRSECDLSRSSCSTGLHFCSFKYLGSYSSNRRIIIVKVHPSNVTAIPPDYGMQKGRCCAYTVVGELPSDQVQDILRGRLVVRSFKEFKLRGDVEEGDDELLNQAVEVGNFERPVEDDVEDDQGVEPEYDDDDVEGSGDDDDDYEEQVDQASAEVLEDEEATAEEEQEDLQPVVSPPKPQIEKPVVKADTKPAKKGKGKVTFTHNGVTYTAKKVLKLIEENGQRGTSKKTGIPRTTLQSWLAIIKG